MKTYFFDTYAFYELIEGNPAYKPYSKGMAILTTVLNLMELHYGMLQSYGKEKANKIFDRLRKFCIYIDDDIIKKANIFRLLNKRKKLSYVDCVGYIIAKSRNIKFLTGDKQFKGMENVEFVK